MNDPKCVFDPIENGYACEIPGRLLAQAQREAVSIPLKGGELVSLSDAQWYEPREGRIGYIGIKDMYFKPDARYIVRYVCRGVVQKYMFAVMLP
jgi:hypothetical protein